MSVLIWIQTVGHSDMKYPELHSYSPTSIFCVCKRRSLLLTHNEACPTICPPAKRQWNDVSGVARFYLLPGNMYSLIWAHSASFHGKYFRRAFEYMQQTS